MPKVGYCRSFWEITSFFISIGITENLRNLNKFVDIFYCPSPNLSGTIGVILPLQISGKLLSSVNRVTKVVKQTFVYKFIVMGK